jgi:ABC-type Fe3+-hydroxamate transport system substrate-binding protein
MTVSILRQRLWLLICLGLLSTIVLAACSDITSTGTSATSNTSPLNAATATAAVQALMKEMTIVGTPTAKIVGGTTFEVDGHIKNGDTLQHDIYIEASLLDASGKPIVTTAPYNVDDVAGGETVPFAVQGTTPQPTWASVKVVVVTVAENVNGTGTD